MTKVIIFIYDYKKSKKSALSVVERTQRKEELKEVCILGVATTVAKDFAINEGREVTKTSGLLMSSTNKR